MRTVLGMNFEGSFFRISYLDSPNIPPIGIPGFDAEKKIHERARSDNQAK
jgi:hypothetical protein